MFLCEHAFKNEPLETYSTVRKGHRIKSKWANGDYSLHCDNMLILFSIIRRILQAFQ